MKETYIEILLKFKYWLYNNKYFIKILIQVEKFIKIVLDFFSNLWIILKILLNYTNSFINRNINLIKNIFFVLMKNLRIMIRIFVKN